MSFLLSLAFFLSPPELEPNESLQIGRWVRNESGEESRESSSPWWLGDREGELDADEEFEEVLSSGAREEQSDNQVKLELRDNAGEV